VFALCWQSAKVRTYSVFSTDDLKNGWRNKADAEIPGTGDLLEYVPEQNGSTQFFKVTVRLSDNYYLP
jgi:hypothetical protein